MPPRLRPLKNKDRVIASSIVHLPSPLMVSGTRQSRAVDEEEQMDVAPADDAQSLTESATQRSSTPDNNDIEQDFEMVGATHNNSGNNELAVIPPVSTPANDAKPNAWILPADHPLMQPVSNADDVTLYTDRVQYQIEAGVRPYVNAAIAARLTNMVQYQNVARAHFAFQRLPRALAWGPYNGVGDNSSGLKSWTNGSVTKPAMAWVLAEVSGGVWNDTTRHTASVYFKPLMASDFDELEAFMRSCDSKDRGRKGTSFYASTNYTRKSMKQDPGFEGFFDSRQSFTGPNGPRLLPSDYERGDIVLIQLAGERYSEEKGVDDNAHSWTTWRSALRLYWVALLRSVPAGTAQILATVPAM